MQCESGDKCKQIRKICAVRFLPPENPKAREESAAKHLEKDAANRLFQHTKNHIRAKPDVVFAFCFLYAVRIAMLSA